MTNLAFIFIILFLLSICGGAVTIVAGKKLNNNSVMDIGVHIFIGSILLIAPIFFIANGITVHPPKYSYNL